MKIPVVVLQYGQFALTRNCFESLRQQTVPVEIILVDGNSPGKDPAVLAELAELADEALLLDQNLGYAGANNVAIQSLLEGKAPYFMVLNNDTVLEPDCLEKLVAAMKEHSKAAQVVPKVLYGDGRLQALGATIRRDLFEPQLIGNLENAEKHTEPGQVLFAPGMAVLVRTAAAREVGAIPDDYFMYAEDVDWSLRFLKAGWEIWTEPTARLTHFESATSGGRSWFKGFYLTRSNVILARRWMSREEWHAWLPRLAFKLLRQAVKHLTSFKYVRGMWQGFFAGIQASADVERLGQLEKGVENVR